MINITKLIEGRATKKGVICIVLAMYWLVILVYALPGSSFRKAFIDFKGPALSLRTHDAATRLKGGLEPLVTTTLFQLNLYQRWKMFIPIRPNAAFLQVNIEAEGGDRQSFTYVERTKRGLFRRARHRHLESALMNPKRRNTFVPVAYPALVSRFAEKGKPIKSVQLIKKAHPLPLLKADETGNPVFTTGVDWRTRSANLTNYVDILLGSFKGVLQEDAIQGE